MNSNYVLGVDIGTGSCRAVLFDTEGNIIDKCSNPYPTQTPQPEWQEQDPEVLIDSFVRSVSGVVQQSEVPPDQLLGVGVSTYFHSLLPVDENGEPLMNCIIWTDMRSKDQADYLREQFDPHDLYERSGCPVHPMYPRSKIVWLQENRPELYSQAHKLISVKSYLFHELFETYVVDWSVASGSGLLNIHELEWDSSILSAIEVDPSKLSTPVPPQEVFKGLDESTARDLHLPVDLPFVIGAGDGVLSTLGSGAMGEGEADNTIGTGGAVRVVRDEPLLDPKERTWCYVLSGDLWVVGGVTCGGLAYKWFKDQFAQEEARIAEREGLDAYDILNGYISEVPPGSDGLLFLPFLIGERTPGWNYRSKGILFGLSAYHTKKHVTRSILEGVGFRRYSAFLGLEDVVGGVKSLRASGGFVKSEEWVQMTSDIYGREIWLPITPETTSLGAALMAMYGLDEFEDLRSAKSLSKLREKVTPDEQRHNYYQKIYEIYQEVYQSSLDKFRKLSDLQSDSFLS